MGVFCSGSPSFDFAQDEFGVWGERGGANEARHQDSFAVVLGYCLISLVLASQHGGWPMRLRFFVSVWVCICGIANAQEDAVGKYRNYTPQEISELPDEERRSSVPMMYTLAAQTALSQDSELYFAMQLNRLMYPAVAAYDASVELFQRDLGDAPTGILTVGQIHELEYRSEIQSLETVGFPDTYGSSSTDQYAYLSGTVTILDDKIAYPINQVEITCTRSEGYCEYEQLVMMIPNRDSWAQTYHIHKFDTEYYRITRWDGNQIDAVPNNPSSGCRINTLNLNFETKEFFEIARNQAGECEVLGTSMPKLDRPRVSQILDGKEIISTEFANLKKTAYEVLSSEFRAKVDAAIAKQQTGSEPD